MSPGPKWTGAFGLLGRHDFELQGAPCGVLEVLEGLLDLLLDLGGPVLVAAGHDHLEGVRVGVLRVAGDPAVDVVEHLALDTGPETIGQAGHLLLDPLAEVQGLLCSHR